MHLFPVTEDTCAATWNPSASLLADPEPVAGIGTPLVAEQAVEELGAALDVSYRSALGLVTDSARALLPPPPVVGTCPGRSVAGVEGSQGRPGDCAPVS